MSKYSMDCNADGSARVRWGDADIWLSPDECRSFLDMVARGSQQFAEMKRIELHGWPKPKRWRFPWSRA